MIKVCEQCGTSYHAYPYNAHKRRFCSTPCANKSTGSQQSATKRLKAKQNLGNTVKWRYNVLYEEWRDACLKRDNRTCQSCDVSLTKSNMAIHHIKPWQDYPDFRYTVSNGMSLCRSCHNIIHVLPSRKLRSGF